VQLQRVRKKTNGGTQAPLHFAARTGATGGATEAAGTGGTGAAVTATGAAGTGGTGAATGAARTGGTGAAAGAAQAAPPEIACCCKNTVKASLKAS
jgi:hypothetical protein